MKAIVRCFITYLILNNTAQAIVLGENDMFNRYSSVGYTLTTGGGLGSVVALDPNWVLTAAHVVQSDPALLVMGDSFAGTEGVYFFFEQVIIHPDYVPGEFHDDLALIKLSPVDPINPTPGVIDASFATLSNVALDGSLPATATLAGYGLTAVDGTFDPTDPIVRRDVTVATDAADPFLTLGLPAFDPGFPYDCSNAALLCTYGTAGGAPGDSGGAMLLDYGGGPVVAGIMSLLFDESDLDPTQALDWTNGYWTVGMSTAYYKDWIMSQVPTAMFGSTPVPIPSVVWLFASGVLGMIAFARRRSSARQSG
jgi:hypothetical protein